MLNIPATASVLTKSSIGAGAHKIDVTTYRYNVGNMNVYMTLADDTCLPVFYESTGVLDNGGNNFNNTCFVNNIVNN